MVGDAVSVHRVIPKRIRDRWMPKLRHKKVTALIAGHYHKNAVCMSYPKSAKKAEGVVATAEEEATKEQESTTESESEEEEEDKGKSPLEVWILCIDYACWRSLEEDAGGGLGLRGTRDDNLQLSGNVLG